MSNIYNGDRSLQAVASVCPLSFTNENNRIANVYFYFVLEINFFEFNLNLIFGHPPTLSISEGGRGWGRLKGRVNSEYNCRLPQKAAGLITKYIYTLTVSLIGIRHS